MIALIRGRASKEKYWGPSAAEFIPLFLKQLKASVAACFDISIITG